MQTVKRVDARQSCCLAGLYHSVCNKLARLRDRIIDFIAPFFQKIASCIGIQKVVSRLALPSAYFHPPKQLPPSYIQLRKGGFLAFHRWRVGSPAPYCLEGQEAPKPEIWIFFNGNGHLKEHATEAFLPIIQGCRNSPYVLTFDYNQTGNSSPAKVSSKVLIESAQACIDYCKAEGFDSQNIHLFGYSLGGAVAAHAKALNPDIGKLVLDRTFCDLPTTVYEVAKELAKVSTLVKVLLFLPKCFIINVIRFLLWACQWNLNTIDIIERIRGPVCIFNATNDNVIRADASLARALKNRAVKLEPGQYVYEEEIKSSRPYPPHMVPLMTTSTGPVIQQFLTT